MKLLETVRLEFRKAQVILQPSDKIKEARAAYTLDLRKEFRRLARQETWRDTSNWEIHHVLPLSFGGNNAKSNLVFLPPDVHVAAHEEINLQTFGMEVGERRTIDLPVFRGLVWG